MPSFLFTLLLSLAKSNRLAPLSQRRSSPDFGTTLTEFTPMKKGGGEQKLASNPFTVPCRVFLKTAALREVSQENYQDFPIQHYLFF